jgi:hypothetical protein
VSPVWLAWLLAASPEPVTLWLRADLPPESPCRLESLSAAIKAQRPDALLALGARSKPTDLEALLAQSGATLTLTVRGPGKPLSRLLPSPGSDCLEAVHTAALMIDRYLDDLNENAEEARIEGLSSSSGVEGAFTVSLGPSVVQGPAGLSAGLVLEIGQRLGLLLLSLGGELNLSQQKKVTAAGVIGSYDLLPAAAWLAAGIAPRLGPGRLVAQASLGLSLLWVTIGQTTPPTFQQQRASGVDPFAGLRLGYALDLSAKFSLALRYEERWVPSPTSFFVEGYPGSVSVRTFSGDLALLVGYALF